jgi:BirA family biotin operon repressor/biotin-[acetyl-CoA-carboxylase] ligase
MRPEYIHLHRTKSTNTYVSELLRSGRADRELVVIADYQERGKGQGGHHWQSDPGENLLMSLLLFPTFLSGSDQFHLSRITSLALCDIIRELYMDPLIKWPNDILVGGRKIAGILIENGIIGQMLSHSIIGIGLNVNQVRFPRFPVPATSLILEGKGQMQVDAIASRLLDALSGRIEQLRGGEVTPIKKAYIEQLYGFGQQCAFKAGGSDFQGFIRGVNRFGELIVEREGKQFEYGFQEIRQLL